MDLYILFLQICTLIIVALVTELLQGFDIKDHETLHNRVCEHFKIDLLNVEKY